MAQKSSSKTKPKAAKAASKPAPKAAAKPAAKAGVKAGAQAGGKKQAKPAPAAKVVEAKKPAKAAAPTPAKTKAASPEKAPARKPAPEVVETVEEIQVVEVQAASLEIHEEEPASDDDIVLTDAEGRRYCKVKDCDQYATVEDHCRFHYLLLWKRIQVRRKILVDGKLERYVEELTARYPDKFLEMIRKDLRTEKDFHAAIAELEIDESNVDNEFEDENSSFIEEVRGMSSEGSSIDSDDDY